VTLITSNPADRGHGAHCVSIFQRNLTQILNFPSGQVQSVDDMAVHGVNDVILLSQAGSAVPLGGQLLVLFPNLIVAGEHFGGGLQAAQGEDDIGIWESGIEATGQDVKVSYGGEWSNFGPRHERTPFEALVCGEAALVGASLASANEDGAFLLDEGSGGGVNGEGEGLDEGRLHGGAAKDFD